MRIIKVPLSRKTIDIIDEIIGSLSILLILFIIGSLYSREFDITLICLILLIPSIIYHWMIFKSDVIFLPKELIERMIIDGIDKDKFSIISQNSKEIIHWKSIDGAKLDKGKNLIINFKDKQKINIEKDCIGWFPLIKSIENLQLQLGVKLTKYINTTFKDLKSCEICGYIALRKNNCLNCLTDKYNEYKLVDFESKYEYIKEEQLEYFGVDSPNEKIEFYPNENDFEIFKFDAKWKLIATEQEVRRYSKLNNYE